MRTSMTPFSEAVYHRQDFYDFEATEFTRRELKVLLLIDGERTVSDIAQLLATDSNTLMPAIASLVRLNLIQTEQGIVSTGIADLIYSDSEPSPVEFTVARLPTAV